MSIAPPASPPPAPRRRGGGGSRALRLWVLAALVVLVAVALGVVFVLPDLVPDPQPRAVVLAPAPPEVPATRAAPRARDPAPDPARAEAETALGEALRRRARLEAIGVALWGGATLGEARVAIAAGDEAFGRGDFARARSAYSEANARLQALMERRARVREEALAAGTAALAQGDGAAAREHFDVALAIEPEDASARLGRERAQTIEAVVALHREGLESEAAGDLDSAVSALERAVAMDAHFVPATEALARVRAGVVERDFRAAMTEVLGALDTGRIAAARAALGRARALRPGDPALSDASRRLAGAERAARLAALRERARALEREERWSDAAATYGEALAIDPHAAFAADGRAVAQARAELYAAMDAHLASPGRLAHDAPHADAERLLAEADGLAGAGPALAERAARLREALAAAHTPVPVVIRSDGLTDVTLYRVGRFGPLLERTVVLRPGRYVVHGTRAGYRDVRSEFTVAAGEPPPVIEVRCEEPI